jgi:ABC-2 type transport system ATP-binding protein
MARPADGATSAEPGRTRFASGQITWWDRLVTEPEERPLLVLAGVSRSYGQLYALKPVDLAVPAGRCIALLGVNGSGKSTLLRIAAGRDSPSSGEVRYAGLPLREDSLAARTEIAVVGDVSSTYPDLTVREHLMLVAVAHGAGGRAPGLVDSALAECRLADHAGARPFSLSSGQRQALQLAAVLVRPRRLLVLDEPEQRLDPGARQWLAGLLVRQKQAGATLLLATHHVELAEAVADEVIVLNDGVIVGRGTPTEALSSLR